MPLERLRGPGQHGIEVPRRRQAGPVWPPRIRDTTDSIAGARLVAAGRARSTALHAISDRVDRNLQPCRQAPVPRAQPGITRWCDRFQQRTRIGVTFLPEQNARERNRGGQCGFGIPKRRGRRIRSATALLGFVQLCEISLRQTEVHHGLDSPFGGAETLEPIVRAEEGGPGLFSAAPAEQETAEPEREIRGAAGIAAAVQRADRGAQCALGCGMTATNREPFYLDDHVRRARIHYRWTASV